MLKLQDKNKKSIKQWEDLSSHKTIVFTINNTEILHCFEDSKSMTIFYGFLDQDYQGDNPAQHVSDILNQFGIEGLNQCYGSFIVLHYDLNTKEFVLANDAMGDFAAHYTTDSGIIHISDLPSDLLTAKNSTINSDRLLHYFALTQPQNAGSFYEQINQLNPGQFWDLTANKVGHYYQVPTKVDFKSNDVKKLSHHFLELMQTVIKYQSQGQSRVGVTMSGGLDSTFVVANARKAGKVVNTFSYVFPTMPEANESMWIDAMRSHGLHMHTFNGEDYWSLKSPWHISLNSPTSNPYRHLKNLIYNSVANKELKILLTGVFADHLYSGYIYWLVDQIKTNPFRAVSSLYSTISSNDLKTGLRQISPKKWSKKPQFKALWLNKASQEALSQKLKSQNKQYHPHPQQSALVHGITTAQSVWLDNEYAYRNNISIRHPFRDRRIVEFLMSLPAWILGTNNLPKQFVRQASKDLLPETIIRRKKNTTLKPLFIKGVLNKEIDKARGLLSDSSCTWQEYINQDLISRFMKDPHKPFKESDYMVLWQVIGYELWRKRLSKL